MTSSDPDAVNNTSEDQPAVDPALQTLAPTDNDGAAETVEKSTEPEQSSHTEIEIDDSPAVASSESDVATQPAAELEQAADDSGSEEAASDFPAEAEAEAEPETLNKFENFLLPPPLIRAIEKLGYEQCTPIQSKALPYALSDYDVTGQAQTGTGKTAAFLISVFTRFWENPLPADLPSGNPRALVLAPTRELALQIEGDAKALGKYMDERTICVVGGMDLQKQKEKLHAKPVDLLIATPGRLIDFVNRKDVSLRNVEVLVIDEADRMLDMGFIPDVRRIVYQTPPKRRRQTLFFSATFNDDVMRLADSWTVEPQHIVIEPEQVATDTVDQKFWMIGTKQKDRALVQLLEQSETERVIIFANRRDQTHRVLNYLRKKNFDAEALAGDIPQRKRLATLKRFKEGSLKYLVATDVAGRGIHVDGVSHVVNYELPEDPEDYVHRIGRTGRAGAEGIAISFIAEDDAFNLPVVEEYLGLKIDCTLPDFELPD